MDSTAKGLGASVLVLLEVHSELPSAAGRKWENIQEEYETLCSIYTIRTM